MYTVYSLDALSKNSCIHTRSARTSHQLHLIGHTNSAVNVAYSSLPTGLIAQNTNSNHSIDKKIAYILTNLVFGGLLQ